MHTDDLRRRLSDLSPEECWELAASRPVGRLAWNGPHGPTVLPVNFTVDGQVVRIRTSGYSAAAREVEDGWVAFQVDDIDVDARTGWSVLMRRRAEMVFGGDVGGPQPWLSDQRSLRLVVDVAEVTGRRIVASG